MGQKNPISKLWENFSGYLSGFNYTEIMINIAFSIGLIILARIIAVILKGMVDRILTPPKDSEKFFVNVKVAQTLKTLIKTLINYSVIFFTAIAILWLFDINLIQAEDIKNLAGKLLQVLIIIAVARALLHIGELAIKNIFFSGEEGKILIEEKRAKTLGALLISVLRYMVYFIAGVMILQTFGVQTSSILASAGIAGLAVGFGAQNLVKDVISGFFIIFEDQFDVGDYVTVAGVTGVVEELGLRSTRIREWTGHLHIIPNGEIKMVKNYNRGSILALVTVDIAYETDINKAIEVMRRTCEKVFHEREDILEVPVVLGVESLKESGIEVLITASTKPGSQWAVQRELRKRLKEDLEAAGIEIPYPRMVVYQRAEEKSGASEE
ncbi:MAG: mechanosensitive ion channel family protein [Clostridia bacterium]|nr:mechanosensitive ion channel family protein [Clostridia bacterium]